MFLSLVILKVLLSAVKLDWVIEQIIPQCQSQSNFTIKKEVLELGSLITVSSMTRIMSHWGKIVDMKSVYSIVSQPKMKILHLALMINYYGK
jgi:hypothetical protein